MGYRSPRVDQVARAMGPTPLEGGAEMFRASDGQWWLISCQEGDQPLPQTRSCATVDDALDQMDAWCASVEWR